ncbi:Aste57867_2236 [Aphanomyces stellatus]|uniref:Aste57867_2236 protein n=1 Tax=Aphanomyces stellatus TaxID=120398 RepID=A0A485K737_9STRA|nr:hypothetical protein As57867_002231 [Aphanomyces stellatus]VFT79439.1 Aste57867_2236 [Aphanomyces stellatus]
MAKLFALDPFSWNQFDDPTHQGTRIDWDKTAFEARINQFYHDGHCCLVDGYAPFCKHLFVPNFVAAKLSTAEITDGNRPFLQSAYVARVPTELPVSDPPILSHGCLFDASGHSLTRWFPMENVQPQVAQYLDIILYSREQLIEEAKATGKDDAAGETAPWGIIYAKAQDVDFELPMDPITIMRNALGKEEGGSGVPCNRDEYMRSVVYWSKHAEIK